ncbi:MAG: hypothetical protein VX938_13115, partial [Myxococcota bacterium]|nr:hypothetical protein [Myxococcota bacterium]
MELLPPRLNTQSSTLMVRCLVVLLSGTFISCVDPQPVTVSGYPQPPVGVTEVIYVNPQASDPAPMGTVDRPYPNLVMALQASKLTDVTEAILIASGVYQEAGTLILDHPVHLVGGSPSPEGEPRVEITGQHPVLLRVVNAEGGSYEPSPALPAIFVQGIAFVGGSNAIAVISGDQASARFEDCDFVGDDDWIQSAEDQKGPYGLVIKDGARVDVIRGAVSGSWRPGIMVQGAAMALSGTSLHDNDEGGIRIERAIE